MVVTSPRPRINFPTDDIAAFCRRWQISELAIFGSVLRDDFKPESDIDFLVTFAEGAPWTLFDLGEMQQEAEELLGRDVDLVERIEVEQSHNWIRRRDILQSAETIYVAR